MEVNRSGTKKRRDPKPKQPPSTVPADVGRRTAAILCATASPRSVASNPVSMSSIMTSKKTNRKKANSKKRPLEHVAPLYSEDIGTDGLKRSQRPPGTHQTFHLRVDDEEESRRQRREERFGMDAEHDSAEQRQLQALPTGRKKRDEKVKEGPDRGEAKGDHATLVGKSTALEKPYRRLTTFPRVDDVRPLPILRKALAHIKNQFIQREDFDWANEQLKAVRQDITVQHLRNRFVLEVYETHARILLEHGDLNEFNQCQTMIRSLTSPYQGSLDELEDDVSTSSELEGLSFGPEGTKQRLQQSDEADDEFRAYGLLYNLVQHSWCDLALTLSTHSSGVNSRNGGGDLSDADTPTKRSQSPPSEGGIPAVVRGSAFRHALKVVKAVIHNDYQTFFRLYESAPHMSAYLMDFLVRRVRNGAFERIIAAYRPTVSVEHAREALVFQDLEETRRFLKKNGAVFVSEQGEPPFWVDCKATFASFANNIS